MTSQYVTRPAIWGKLPGHADFVRSGMRHGESEGWQPWLAQHAQGGHAAADDGHRAVLPASFVLPPATLAFAPREFVVGVITPSRDRVGRHHALLIYQLASPRWVERHFQTHASEPRDWLFWLARALARHTGPHGVPEIQALEQTVQALWRLYAPRWLDVWLGRREAIHKLQSRQDASQAALREFAGPDLCDDPALELHGVRHLPWADWPHRLHRPRAQAAFWQQDPWGGFVGATNSLAALWRLRP